MKLSLYSLLVILLLVDILPSSLWAQTLSLKFDGVIGREGIGVGQLMNPSAVAIDPAGNLYIVDAGNNRVQLFDQHGRYVRHIGGFGFGSGQFNRPQGLAATGLDVFVADTQNRRIQRLDRRLNFLGTLPGELDVQDDPIDAFGFPSGIAVSNIGDIYITDAENEEIVKMNTSGAVEVRFGGFNDGRGRLREPGDIAIGRSGLIYVADTGNGRIVVFDAFGGFLRTIGADSLRTPRGITLDRQGRIYLADTGNHRTVVFSNKGGLLLRFGTEGSGAGSFLRPQDIEIDTENAVYIVDTGNHRIQKFTLREIEEDGAK
ncbi:MAG: NHL repeat-containing protein [Gemmatimonadota bacterium]|nr:NHL repeat-containing protein [Gemmatimonadota bacterium]